MKVKRQFSRFFQKSFRKMGATKSRNEISRIFSDFGDGFKQNTEIGMKCHREKDRVRIL